MTRPPIIAINCDNFRDTNGEITGVRSPYWRAVAAAGGAPVLIPHIENEQALEALLSRVDGVLLTGGDDLRAERLGLPIHPAAAPVTLERDRTDFTLLEKLLARRIPTLAICLACQELNVIRGGTIYQDLPSERPAGLSHRGLGEERFTEHAVSIAPATHLARLWPDAADLRINSCHHQAVRDVGIGLRPAALAPDGLVEALEVVDHPYFVGVQWHPERMEGDARQRRLFEALIERARDGV